MDAVPQNGKAPGQGSNDNVPEPMSLPRKPGHEVIPVPTALSLVPRMMRTNPDDEELTPHLVFVWDTPVSRNCYAYPLHALPAVVKHLIESIRATPTALGLPSENAPRLIVPGT